MFEPNYDQQVVFIKAKNGRFTYISPNVNQLLGLSVLDVLHKTELELFASLWGFESMAVDEKVYLTGEVSQIDVDYLVGGEQRKLKIIKHPHLADDGEIIGVIGTIQEIPDKADSVEPTPIPVEEKNHGNNFETDVLPLYRGLLTLQSASAAISVSLEPEQILETYTWELANLLDADGCLVMRLQESENKLLTIASYQHERWQNELSLDDIEFDLAEHESLNRLLQERSTKQLFYKDNPELSNGLDYLGRLDVQGLLVLPLIYHEGLVGLVLVLNHHAERPFADIEVSLAQLLTDQAAGFFLNAWLFAEIEEMNESLRVSNAELDAFAHTVAHDLKSPLANTIGFANILVQEYDTLSLEEKQEFLKIISKNGKRMRGIIDGLLLLASVRKEDVVIGPIDMEGAINEVIARFYYTIMESNAQIKVETDCIDGLGYRPWIDEVWANYIGNAIKYGGDPPLIEVGSEKQADGKVRYWVRDNGQGLTEEQQSKLFVPFVRLGLNDNRGHGLGLSIVQRIITRLGGEVGLTSQPGKGCEFFFTLPGTFSSKKKV